MSHLQFDLYQQWNIFFVWNSMTGSGNFEASKETEIDVAIFWKILPHTEIFPSCYPLACIL